MINLTKKEILLIHYTIMEEHDDDDPAGVKFEEKFEAMFARPDTNYYGVELFPSTFEKACCMYHSIARDHIFYNGNKRTALAVFLVLLELNNIELKIDEKFLEDFTVNIAWDEKYKGDDAVSTIVAELSSYIND